MTASDKATDDVRGGSQPGAVPSHGVDTQPKDQSPELTTKTAEGRASKGSEPTSYVSTRASNSNTDSTKESHQASMPELVNRNISVFPHYRPLPKRTWGQATSILLKSFWAYFLTPLGFAVVIYFLNIVAWGGMLFLLLCNAAPAMNHPTKDDINSPRRKWIEVDSQILTALFSITGLGLIPWRFRDLYYLLKWRIFRKISGLRTLAGINKDWLRLPGSELLEVPPLDDYPPPNPTEDNLKPRKHVISDSDVTNPAVPLPPSMAPDLPLTGVRAPPTKLWKLDFAVWAMVWNTFFQIILCVFMWKYNRATRASWATGLFIALSFGAAAAGGGVSMMESRRVKKVEGVPWEMVDVEIDTAQSDIEKVTPGDTSLRLKETVSTRFNDVV